MNELNSSTQLTHQHHNLKQNQNSDLNHIPKGNQPLKDNHQKKTLLKNALRENLVKRKKMTENT